MASETCHEAAPFSQNPTTGGSCYEQRQTWHHHTSGLLLYPLTQISQSYKPSTGIPHFLQPWEPPLTQSLSQGRLPWSQESRE